MSIDISGFKIPLYAVMVTLGVAVACLVGVMLRKKRGLDVFTLVSAGAYALGFGFIGAKLLYVIASLDSVVSIMSLEGVSLWMKIYALLAGGFVFYGGFIGGFLGLVIYCRQFKVELFGLLDVFAVALPLGHAFGRIGCFLGGCCYGISYDGPISYTYQDSLNASVPVGVPLLPIQLFEAVALVLIFAAVLWAFCKGRKELHLPVFIYLISYSIVRFIIEFFRGDTERGKLLFLSTSQWISVLILVSVGLYFARLHRSKRGKKCDFAEKQEK